MYDYYQNDNGARERIRRRSREADAERIIRRARTGQRRRRRALLAAAWELLIARRQARAGA